MSTSIETFRDALQTYLATQLSAANVDAGERAGVSRSGARVVVFWSGFQEWPQDVNNANVTYTIRYWPARSKQPATASPPDPDDLEAAALDLMQKLQSVQTSLSGMDYCRVTSVRPDYDPKEWGVEATLLCWTRSPASTGG